MLTVGSVQAMRNPSHNSLLLRMDAAGFSKLSRSMLGTAARGYTKRSWRDHWWWTKLISAMLTKKKASMKRPHHNSGPAHKAQGTGAAASVPSKSWRIASRSRGTAQWGMCGQSRSDQLFSGVA